MEGSGLADRGAHGYDARLSGRWRARGEHGDPSRRIVGAAFMIKRARSPVWLLLAPGTMGLAAACVGQYPYGGAPRITQYLAPSICLFSGLGLPLSGTTSLAISAPGPTIGGGLLAMLGLS